MAAISSKVRPTCSHLNYLYRLLDSTNTFALMKQFSTATERTSIQTELPNSFNGSHREPQQSPNRYYRENPNRHSECQKIQKGCNSQNFREFQQNPLGDVCENKVSIDKLDSFCKEGKVKEAVEVLELLEKQGFDVDWPRYLQLMQACGEAVATQEAKAIHNHLLRSKPHMEVGVQNKILEMYLKCGSILDAYELFKRMPECNLTSWYTMIVGLTESGLGEDAIDLFTRFKKTGLRPDAQMFVGVFSACSSIHDIDEGMLHFQSRSKVYGLVPSMNHYVSVVEMMGSVGYLDEALEFIENMPLEPSVVVWETLMNLCRIHGNLELGNRCAGLVDQLDPSRLTDQSKSGLLVVSASDVAKEKENTPSFRAAHEFIAGDKNHPESDKIYALLMRLSSQMRDAGYVPQTKCLLYDIDEESKEEILLSRSGLLALAAALMNSSARAPIRIIKNCRFLVDEHNAMKIISKLVGRELIVPAPKTQHRIKDGWCSCRDYW